MVTGESTKVEHVPGAGKGKSQVQRLTASERIRTLIP